MTWSNFKLIWGFGIAEKEIKKRQVDIKNIIDKYYQVGIREFFIGYNPPYWHNRFWFEFSPNWRFWENEQITSYDTFKEAIEYVHSLKTDDGSSCEIYLTVNFRYYSDITFPYIKQIIDEAIKAWVDWLIVWAPEVLEYLAEIWFKWKIHISTILSIYNADAVSFFLDYFKNQWLKLNRVILPRELTLNEIESISKTFPEINFEVFGHGDYCRYANWLCLAEHKYFSRDLCWFVLKHWLEFKKALRYDFKKIILDDTTSNNEKQQLIDNNLNEIKYIFTSQTVVDSNWRNNLMNEYISKFQNKFWETISNEEISQIASEIYKLMWRELILNFAKFIYDWLRPFNDIHNEFIDNFITLHSLITPYIQADNKIEENIKVIKNIRKKVIQYFESQKNQKWLFWIETYYKFMLYNRTSVPFYSFFNSISNIKVVKIPLRWRDVTVFNLWLEMITDAINNPDKYIDEWNINWKYFHYDPSKLEIYKTKLDNLISN